MSITLTSFTPGTTILSAQVNANFTSVANAINAITGELAGTTANVFTFLSTSNATPTLSVQLPSAPSSDQDVVQTEISGDTASRIATYIQTSTNAGGIRAGVNGTSYIAHMFAFNGTNAQGFAVSDPFTFQNTLGGANKLLALFHTTDGKDIGLIINHSTLAPFFYNYTNSFYMQEFNPTDGSIYISTGTSTPGNYFAQLASNGGGSAGKKVWVGTTDPGSNAAEGDIWLDA